MLPLVLQLRYHAPPIPCTATAPTSMHRAMHVRPQARALCTHAPRDPQEAADIFGDVGALMELYEGARAAGEEEEELEVVPGGCLPVPVGRILNGVVGMENLKRCVRMGVERVV